MREPSLRATIFASSDQAVQRTLAYREELRRRQWRQSKRLQLDHGAALRRTLGCSAAKVFQDWGAATEIIGSFLDREKARVHGAALPAKLCSTIRSTLLALLMTPFAFSAPAPIRSGYRKGARRKARCLRVVVMVMLASPLGGGASTYEWLLPSE
jgi:hypothetical protein